MKTRRGLIKKIIQERRIVFLSKINLKM